MHHSLCCDARMMLVCVPCRVLHADDCDDRLSALVQRARHYKTEAERLHDKERAAAGGGMAAHSASLPHPSINWGSAPWR